MCVCVCVCVFAFMYEYVCVQVRAGVFGVAKAIILSGSRSGSSEDEEVCSMQRRWARGTLASSPPRGAGSCGSGVIPCVCVFCVAEW